jgi:hypothetical protein
MLYRNAMAMDVEESGRSYPLEGVVLLTGSEKSNSGSGRGRSVATPDAVTRL